MPLVFKKETEKMKYQLNEVQRAACKKLFELDLDVTYTFNLWNQDKDNKELEEAYNKAKSLSSSYYDAYTSINLIDDDMIKDYNADFE